MDDSSDEVRRRYTTTPIDPADLFRERLERRRKMIEESAMLTVAEEQFRAAVEARANEIRRKYSMSLWQRLLSKLPFCKEKP
jgi:hypothetical protein